MEGRGAEGTIVRWVDAMLRSRVVSSRLGETVSYAEVRRGCPQGGVLSPLLWSLVVDSLLDELNSQGLYCQGYADDGAILVSGPDLDVVCGLVQTALSAVEPCRGQGLGVNPTKTELILFTRRKNRDGFLPPTFYRQQLTLVNQVKFLGVIDRKSVV
jgi:hypothetical protein